MSKSRRECDIAVTAGSQYNGSQLFKMPEKLPAPCVLLDNHSKQLSMTAAVQSKIVHTTLEERSLVELEFDKVLELVTPFALTERAAALIRELRPMRDGERCNALHAAIAEILSLRQQGKDLPLDRTDDPTRLLHRATIAGAYLSASELLTIAELLGVSRRMLHFLRERSQDLPELAAIATSLVDLRVLERHIHDAIDPTASVRDDASQELRRIRTEIASVSYTLRNKLRRIVQRLGDEELLQDEFYTIRDGRMVVPLKVEYKRALPGIIHGISQSGATVFFEPSEVFELNNQLAELRSAEEREIIRILQALTAEVGAYASQIAAADQALTLLDSLRARALFAEQYQCMRPEIVSDGTIELYKVYHPLLVATKGHNKVVPLSVSFDREHRGYLISGPNAGGKSIAIKTIGVSVAMALAGIFPLGQMKVSPVTLLAAIGDHQSIESNLSTFSSQLVRLRDIIARCDETTLAIVDEICAGTDPSEGSALAAAIIDEVLDRGGYIVATTHQFTLKTYALTRPHLLNASMEFDTERLEPTYRFLPGVPGNSYAIELAHALALPEPVIERARQYLGSAHARIEESIQQLHELRKTMEERSAMAAQHELQAKQYKEQYEAKFQQFKSKYTALMNAARQEAADLIAQLKEELRQIRAQAQQGSLEAARVALQKLQEEVARTMPGTSESATTAEPVSVGDTAEIIGTRQQGTVVEVTPKKVVLEVGAVRISVSPDAVRRVHAPAALPKQSTATRPLKLDAPTQLDIRGLRVNEALPIIERALNDAVVGGVLRLAVVHGTGSGQLRNAVHEYLREHPLVASFQTGTPGQGDAGVTYITLR
ncbi:MAG: endonuclease MutS2 [Bacteroidota bacterium]|nr:endonuclease MutS2 [Bacteroidota bacterium]MDW8271514.1 endonuclease MutS2 [Bacteroidota bacterium]